MTKQQAAKKLEALVKAGDKLKEQLAKQAEHIDELRQLAGEAIQAMPEPAASNGRKPKAPKEPEPVAEPACV